MIRNIRVLLPGLSISALLFAGCQNDLSEVGSSLSRGEVTITVENSVYNLQGRSQEMKSFDGRAATNLLGRLSTPEYGELECSYVTRLLPTPLLGIPNDIPEEAIDSMKVVLTVPRGSLAGDSLAPQQVSVYRLDKQIPQDIDNNFDPSSLYTQAGFLCSKNYTLSGLALTQEQFATAQALEIRMEVPREYALDVVRKYRTEPQTFQWPSSFAQWMPGIYVEHSFGRGCVANVTQTKSLIYYHYPTMVSEVQDGVVVQKEVTTRDSVCNFVTSPAVLSSNCVSYKPSAHLEAFAASGKALITSPGGYITYIRFPAEGLLKTLRGTDKSMTIVSNLTMSIPATQIEGKVEMSPAPFLAMIPVSELDAFFAENRVPDDKTSFWATYDHDSGAYNFTSMRQFITDLDALPSLAGVELDYAVVPVLIGTENLTDSYGNITGMKVVSCTPYMARPTMCVLDTEKGSFTFTFSRQTL